MNLLRKICGFMGGIALLSYIYSAYVSKRRCHKHAFPSKWSQLIALDFLLETAELSWDSDQSSATAAIKVFM